MDTPNLTKHEEHEWVAEHKAVAIGYGVSPQTIHTHKKNHADELIEGQHYFKARDEERNADITYWTKRGVLRLGFYIKSEQAARFRDWAESVLIGESGIVELPKQPVFSLPSVEEGADRVMEAIEAKRKQWKADVGEVVKERMGKLTDLIQEIQEELTA